MVQSWFSGVYMQRVGRDTKSVQYLNITFRFILQKDQNKDVRKYLRHILSKNTKTKGEEQYFQYLPIKTTLPEREVEEF